MVDAELAKHDFGLHMVDAGSAGLGSRPPVVDAG